MPAKILLVSESPHTMSRLEMALSSHGHTVVPVKKVSEAAALIEGDSTYDAVVCDLISPVMDSFDLLKMIRADHVRSDLPFIFIVDEQQLLTDSLRKTAAIYGCDKFIFMDEFDPHRTRLEIEAMLPEQLCGRAFTVAPDDNIGPQL